MEYLSPDEFKNLSSEEKKEYVRKLIHSEAAEVHAAFYNPVTGETVDAKGLVEEVGEEEALDIITRALESCDITPTKLTGEDIKKLLEKAHRGECTEEELVMLDFIKSHILESGDDVQFQKAFMEEFVGLLYFSQESVGYNPKISDLLTATIILLTTSGTLSENGPLSKYRIQDAGMITDMCGQIADDIYSTWEATCASLPDPELIVISLIQLATKIAFENEILLSSAKDLADTMHLSVLEDIDEMQENGSNEMPNVCKPVTHNPSSDSSDDEEMRDLLKE